MAAVFVALAAGAPGARAQDRLDTARAAAKWIAASAIESPHGLTWPADPRDPKSVVPNLYTGTPGVVLFLLEMHHATGDKT